MTPMDRDKAKFKEALLADASRALYPECMGVIKSEMVRRVAAWLKARLEAEREENCKAVCFLCAGEGRNRKAEPFNEAGEWWHAWGDPDEQFVQPEWCAASPIRNLPRSAAPSEIPR